MLDVILIYREFAHILCMSVYYIMYITLCNNVNLSVTFDINMQVFSGFALLWLIYQE